MKISQKRNSPKSIRPSIDTAPYNHAHGTIGAAQTEECNNHVVIIPPSHATLGSILRRAMLLPPIAVTIIIL